MNLLLIIIAIVVFILDQTSKLLATKLLVFGKSFKVINNFFYLNIAHNTGAAFSIFNDSTVFLILITIVIFIFLYFYKKEFENNKLNNISFGLVYGGLLGNFLDRIIHGYVIDFLDFYIFGYDYPIFNIADIAIVIGIIILLISSFRKGSKNEVRSK